MLWDKLCNKLATHIVAISGVVQEILVGWEGAEPSKVRLIPHGFQLAYFHEVSEDRIGAFRKRIQVRPDQKIVGVVSRFTEWKGVQYIIPAFTDHYQSHPEAVLVLLNSHGDYENRLKAQLDHLPASAYRLVRFENDIAAAYRSMDVFVHVPFDAHSEAFGQTYVEALAAGVPSIFTLSGIAPDFIVHEENALIVPYRNPKAIFEAMVRLENEPELRAHISNSGRRSVSERFSLTKMLDQLENMYDAG